MLTLQIILGSSRDTRLGGDVAAWLMALAKERQDFQPELLDLKEWNLPFLNEPNPASGEYVSDVTKKWSEKISQGDGYIMIVPEYNHGYSAVLKNAVDHLYKEWNNKPVAFVGYAGSMSGGIRAVEQMRQVAVELQMTPTRQAVFLPALWQAAGQPDFYAQYNQAANQMFDQLIWWAEALKQARAKV